MKDVCEKKKIPGYPGGMDLPMEVFPGFRDPANQGPPTAMVLGVPVTAHAGGRLWHPSSTGC